MGQKRANAHSVCLEPSFLTRQTAFPRAVARARLLSRQGMRGVHGPGMGLDFAWDMAIDPEHRAWSLEARGWRDSRDS